MRALVGGALALILSTSVIARTVASPPPSEAETVEHGPHLTGETATLPLVLIKGYPFVEGAINGTKGKLLFDLGEGLALAVDDHTVTLPDGVVTGQGMFGSGQTFQTMRYPRVDTLTLPNGLRFTAMTNVRGSPGLPLEQHITPDFIGWLGLAFYSGYVAKLDYARPAVTFYRDDANGNGVRAAERGERVVTTVALGNRGRPDLSTYPITLGKTEVVGLVDTGSHNTAWLTEAQQAALERTGNVRGDGHGGFTLSGAMLGGIALPTMPLDIVPGKPPMMKLLPSSDAPHLVLGYEFLKRYKTVLDYGRGTMTLLRP